MTRRICYVSGSRADFGLMRSALQRAHAHPDLDVCVCVTGMHLSQRYGMTVADIEQSGLRICGRVEVELDRTSGAAMAHAIGRELIGMTDLFDRERPDAVVVLGDRGEMLAATIAAVHLNIPVVHVHGGERSGTVDEPVRHAISKFAHYHFVATAGARDRLVRMGEDEDRIFVTGAPGLDDICAQPRPDRVALSGAVGLDPERPIALVLFHPIVQQQAELAEQTRRLRQAILELGLQALWMTPNADAGGDHIREVLDESSHPGIVVATHLERAAFIGWLASADVMIGNSSSGIIEAPSFGTPVVNVGERQRGRDRSANIIDCDTSLTDLRAAIERALATGRKAVVNVWGDGRAGERIMQLLATLPLGGALMEKANAY